MDELAASRLRCGQKCLTLLEVEHNTNVQSALDYLYFLSQASSPTVEGRIEYGGFLRRTADNRIILDTPIPGTVGTVDPGASPASAIAFIHTHPNGFAYGDRPGEVIDGPDAAYLDYNRTVGVVVTQHRWIYYQPGPNPGPSGATAKIAIFEHAAY